MSLPSGRTVQRLSSELTPQARRAKVFKRSILTEYTEHSTAVALILPIQAAASYLDHVLDDISISALTEWLGQKPEMSALTLGLDNMSLTFVSSNPNVPVPWQFIMFLCDELAHHVQLGWTGVYSGTWTHTVTQVAISVQMRIIMAAAAA